MKAVLRPSRALVLALVSVLIAAALLRTPAASQDTEQPPASSLKLESLAWLAGHWSATGESGVTEELWLPPRGGMMLGLNRAVRGEEASFELLRIEQDDHGIVYLASPGGAKPTPFRLSEVDEQRAIFLNPDHGDPKRIEYRLDAEGRLVASLAGDTAGLKPGPSWTFERRAPLE